MTKSAKISLQYVCSILVEAKSGPDQRFDETCQQSINKEILAELEMKGVFCWVMAFSGKLLALIC